MTLQQLLDFVRTLDGALIWSPEEGSDTPPIAWGDHFFYHAPDGQVPPNVQPYGTVVTKNYPDDTASDLDGEGRWRVNVHVGRDRFEELTGGEGPQDLGTSDFSVVDTVLPHPVYRALGWVCVINPGDRTSDVVQGMLRDAHADAVARAERRAEVTGQDDTSTG